MGWLGNLIAKPASGVITESLGAAGSLAKDIRTAITGQEPIDPMKLAELEQQILVAQAEIGKAEAGHASVFVAGWRPAIGWTCALGLLMEFLVRPLVAWFGGRELPVLDVGQLVALVVSMLGLSAYRTVEKAQGVVAKH